MASLAVFNPNPNFGGAEILFKKLIPFWLRSYVEIQVYCIEGSRFESELKLFSGNLKFVYDLDGIVAAENIICTGQFFRFLQRYGESICGSKILVWILHPDEFPSVFKPGFFRLKNSFFSFLGLHNYLPIKLAWVSRLVESNKLGFMFMDGRIRAASLRFARDNQLERIGFGVDQLNYISPMPATSVWFPNEKYDRQAITSLGYFGRIEDFKTKVVLKLIDDISHYSPFVDFHLIGDGACSGQVLKYAKSKKVNCIFYGFVANDLAKRIIADKVDVCYAMGIAALDSASTMTPTVVCNPFTQGVKANYCWVFSLQDYSLGDYVDKNNEQCMMDFESTIVSSSEEYFLLSKKSYDYVHENHDLSIVADISLKNLDAFFIG